jgi:hypothetical protein
MSQPPHSQEFYLAQIIGFFNLGVLASYESQPDRYLLHTDHFEGTLTSCGADDRLDSGSDSDQQIDIRFGYRTLANGSLAVAAYLPDLFEKSRGHVRRWSGFVLDNPVWSLERDERFEFWIKRYFEGSWDVENGPRWQLEEAVRTLNALTSEVVGSRLFRTEDPSGILFPLAQNSHQYQAAHQRLYGYLIDGLVIDCIRRIANYMGNPLDPREDKTKKALRDTVTLPEQSLLWNALERVSDQRRRSAHGTRDVAQPFRAFEEFTADLEHLVSGLGDLQRSLENAFGVSAERARKRAEAKKWLPVITRSPDPLYAICRIEEMKGRIVERVEYGFRQDVENVHGSEAIILHFTDGSVLGIHTGSNAGNLSSVHPELRPEDFEVDFDVQWVPPLRAPSSRAKATEE